MPRLTEQEQQEIIRYLEADKPLPERFRFLLFEDKREPICRPREAPRSRGLPNMERLRQMALCE